MGTMLTGDQHKVANKRIGELLRQLGQKEYPYDPEKLIAALQAIGEGQFGMIGCKFPSRIFVPELIPTYTDDAGNTCQAEVVEDVQPSDFLVEGLEFIPLLKPGESSIKCPVMQKRAVALRANLGLVDGRRILVEQEKIPVELRGKTLILLPGTLVRRWHYTEFSFLIWSIDRWTMVFNRFDADFDGSSILARPKKR